MTIDRIPVWVAASLLGLGSFVRAEDEIPSPKPHFELKADRGDAAPSQPVFGWAEERDLPLFDFAQIPSVLNDPGAGNEVTNKSPVRTVSTHANPDSKRDREIEHHARLFRIWTFESFQHDSREYRRRINEAQHILRVWEYEGSDLAHRDALKQWFHQAAIASTTNKPLPECLFLNQDLLAQARAGVSFTPKGGPRAGIAFVRAMVRGSVQWMAPQGMVTAALTAPLPFELPDPATIVKDAPGTDAETITPPAEPVAELEISPIPGSADVGPAVNVDVEAAKPTINQ